MTRRHAVIALASIGLALGACAARKAPETPPPAAPSTPVVEVTATSLNVRAEPSPTGAVVGSLARGARASAPQAEEGGWLYIESDAGPKGYVASKYVRVVEGAARIRVYLPTACPDRAVFRALAGRFCAAGP